jgi:two-component system sensor histidine kinase KdpD
MSNQNTDSIMVCLSPSPSNIHVIRVASSMLQNKKDHFYALYISDTKRTLSDSNQEQLDKNIAYAKQLGAEVEIVSSEDIAGEIFKFANIYKVNKLVIGKNMNMRLHLFQKPIDQYLLDNIEDINLIIVPVKENRIFKRLNNKSKLTLKSIVTSILILFICTVVGFVFFEMGFHDSNIIMIYLIGVLLIALITSNIICSVVSSIASVILFNFYFTLPILSLSFYDSAYLMTFVIMIIVAFLISTLMNKIQLTAASYANMANVSRILLETNQLLQKRQSVEDIFKCGCKQLSNLFNRDIAYFPIEKSSIQSPILFPKRENSCCKEFLNANEIGVAKWVAINGKHAGATTRYLSGSKSIYYAVLTDDKIYGVIGIYLGNDVLGSFDKRILLAILSEMAICLENIKSNEEKNEAIIKVKKEQFRSDLLRSISHDLRTPLTSIYGNADVLLNDNGNLKNDKKNALYKNIYDDSLWLINLVENLLSMTSIEDGSVKLRIEPEVIEDVIDESLSHVSRIKDNRKIKVNIADDFLMADMDARLIVQVLINLINNAIKYTEDESTISINAYQIKNNVYIEVCDNGSGIKDIDKNKIFEKFYTVNHSVVDSKKSMGLGLSLCKSIVEAHGGVISVKDNHPTGAIFTFSLPATKITINKNMVNC